MLGYTAIGKILNIKTKGVMGYKVKDEKGNTYNYKIKDIKSLVKENKFTNLETNNNGYVVVIGTDNLDKYYVTDTGEIFNQKEYDKITKADKVKEVVSKKEESNVVIEERKDNELLRVICDNFEYNIFLRVYDKDLLNDIKEVTKKVKQKSDKFNGSYLEVECDEAQLEELVENLGIKVKTDEVALLLYLQDEEYIGTYIENERRIEWYSKEKVNYETDLRIIERVQELCSLMGEYEVYAI